MGDIKNNISPGDYLVLVSSCALDIVGENSSNARKTWCSKFSV